MSRTVLIVEDDPDICLILSDLLEHSGYDIDVARSADEALSKWRQRDFGAVILDYILPDMDAEIVLMILQRLAPKLPVIVLTGYTTEDATIGMMEKGAFEYLTKPFDRDLLRSTLQRALESWTFFARICEAMPFPAPRPFDESSSIASWTHGFH